MGSIKVSVTGNGYVRVATRPTGTTGEWTVINYVYVTRPETIQIDSNTDIGLSPQPCANFSKYCYVLGIGSECVTKADIDTQVGRDICTGDPITSQYAKVHPSQLSTTAENTIAYTFTGSSILGYLRDPLVYGSGIAIILIIILSGLFKRRKRR